MMQHDTCTILGCICTYCIYNYLLCDINLFHVLFGIFIVSFTPKTAVLFPGGTVTFMCNVVNKFWLINDTTIRLTDNELRSINGVTSTGPQLLTLVITQSANNTLYGCGVPMSGRFVTDTGVVYVAGMHIHTRMIDSLEVYNNIIMLMMFMS